SRRRWAGGSAGDADVGERYYGFFVGRFQPSMLVCRPRATLSFSFGASLVITEPAPMVAFSPMVTGATSDEFEPMNAPSSMRVSNLLTPSQLQVMVPAPTLTPLPISPSPR